MSDFNLSNKYIYEKCKLALKEDLYPYGDITTKLIKKKILGRAKLISNDDGIIGGLKFVKTTFKLIDESIYFSTKKTDGSKIKKGEVIGVIKGNVKNILIGERVALNFLSHISGVATKQINLLEQSSTKLKFVVQEKQFQE